MKKGKRLKKLKPLKPLKKIKGGIGKALHLPQHEPKEIKVVKTRKPLIAPGLPLTAAQKLVTKDEAEAAVRTLIIWAGDNPDREGLRGTPDRVTRAYREFFRGYDEDPNELLSRTFEETEGYDEMITLKDIEFESYCEHHMVPILGKVHIGYIPNRRVVGISKLARVVDVYAKRLQIQEKLTSQVAMTIEEVLQPRGVGVIVEAQHQCMTTRGVQKTGVVMQTSRMTGLFRSDKRTRDEFMQLIKG